MANTNCLKNIVCPTCGNEEEFKIEASSWFTMHDDGTDSFGDVVYDETAPIRCPRCEHAATVADFTASSEHSDPSFTREDRDLTVTSYTGADGAIVVQIDTGDATGALRVNINDTAAIHCGDVEKDDLLYGVDAENEKDRRFGERREGVIDGVKVTCPTAPTGPDGKPHTIRGCGSSNVTWDADVFDCLDCGIFFNAAEVVWDRRYKAIHGG